MNKLYKVIITVTLFGCTLAAKSQGWSSLNSASISLYQLGKYAQSVALAEQALSVAKDSLGEKSEAYISSLSNKAYAQSALGDYLHALNNFKYAANLSLDMYQQPHVSQVETLGEVSKTFTILGVYDSAEYYLNLAKHVYTSVPEQNRQHQDTATLDLFNALFRLNGVESSLLHKKGKVQEAIELLEEQLIGLRQVYPTHYKAIADYQRTVYNLSNYSNEVFDYKKSKAYSWAYFRLVENNGNKLDQIHALQALGSSYRNLEQLDSAIYYWNQELTMLESSAYNNSFIHTALLNNLGELYLFMESYNKAILKLQQSLQIQFSKQATNPPLYQATLYNLAESYRWSGQYAQADSIYDNLMNDLLNEITHNFTYLSDSEKLSFYKKQLLYIDSFNSFALEISGIIPLQDSADPYIDANIAGRLYDLQLTTKAIILDASKRMKSNILNSGNNNLISNYTLWEEQKNELAQALVEGKKSKEELGLLKSVIEGNEKWLLQNSRNFKAGFQTNQVKWQQVQKSLQPGEAAIEIIRLIDGLVYGALIITPETTEHPIFSLIMSTRSRHLEKQFYKNYHNSIVYQQKDTMSYNTYWQPIIDSVSKHMPLGKPPKQIYVSNDGIYNQINLNTLYDATTGQYVLDKTNIVIVTNTKELTIPQKNSNTKHRRKAALFGRPKFSTNQSNGNLFKDLPATEMEVQIIDSILLAANWQTQVFIGNSATEGNLKNLEAYNVLHLASHGFFNPMAGNANISLAETLINSGIVLANADDITTSTNDGLLTAFEVISLNLDSTNLVILSACETAKGVDNHGEGVYGLQRALHVAGAQNMIMSLWKVDDIVTQELMTKFYEYWILSDDLRLAFKNAQKAVRKTHPSPYYWGAFILTTK